VIPQFRGATVPVVEWQGLAVFERRGPGPEFARRSLGIRLALISMGQSRIRTLTLLRTFRFRHVTMRRAPWLMAKPMPAVKPVTLAPLFSELKIHAKSLPL